VREKNSGGNCKYIRSPGPVQFISSSLNVSISPEQAFCILCKRLQLCSVFASGVAAKVQQKVGQELSDLAIYLLLKDCENRHQQTMNSPKFIWQLAVLLLTISPIGGYGQTVAASQPNAPRLTDPGGGADVAASRDPKTSLRTSQFILGVADVIRVNVWKNTDLSQTLTIGPDGFISLPLLGDFHVAGMTANQLAEEISSRLKAYVVSAEVTVSVVDIRSRQVYVLGQVGKPGAYPLIAPITVLQLIAQAGGLTTFANRKEIAILRGPASGVQRLTFNYNSAIRGDSKQNISLQPGDTVIVAP
jgi:polysaccharide biosynthesis/export protein